MRYLVAVPKGLTTNSPLRSFPTGLSYVSAAMKEEGLDVITANLDLPDVDTRAFLREKIEDDGVDVVCTGGLSSNCSILLSLIETVREISKDVVVVVGGGIISSDPETAMNVLKPDFGVIGEGEVTICELAKALNGETSTSDVSGLAYWDKEGNLHHTPRRKEIDDLDSLPLPDFDGFGYREYLERQDYQGFMIAARSCPFKCTFCFHPTGSKYRLRSLDNVFQEIEMQIAKYGIKTLTILDELFAVNKRRITEFCRRIKALDIDWHVSLRVSDISHELLGLMKDSGCTAMTLGLESVNDGILRSMRKGTTAVQTKKAIQVMSDLGVHSTGLFIFGDKEETLDTARETIDYWKESRAKIKVDLTTLIPYPGTFLYRYACEEGYIKSKEKYLRADCPPVNVTKMTDEEYREMEGMVLEARYVQHFHADLISIKKIDETGHCDIEWQCFRCGGTNEANVFYWFSGGDYCSHCRAMNLYMVFRYAERDEEHFLEKLPADEDVVLWGAGGIHYELSNMYDALLEKRFHLVDGSKRLIGLKRCGRIIHSPQIIQSQRIRTVVILALSHKEAIRSQIQSGFPTVTNVFTPDYELISDKVFHTLRRQ